jgi:prolyl-tRNA editing enzyme YbaK/EbsC (Cys-tRNA(Pro) deacylase)
MLGTIVDYLHSARVPFRFASYPSEEARPLAAHHLPPRGILVEGRPVLAAGTPLLLVFPADESPDLAAVGTALGTLVAPSTNAELPTEIAYEEGPVPPLGQLLGIPVVCDERLAHAGVLVFRAFSESNYFEIPYDDYARLEQPRLVSFASAGELGMGSTSNLK